MGVLAKEAKKRRAKALNDAPVERIKHIVRQVLMEEFGLDRVDVGIQSPPQIENAITVEDVEIIE